MNFERKTFWQKYHAQFGSVSQNQVDAINGLLVNFEQDRAWKDLRHVAYALATVKHETANTFLPIKEFGRGKNHPYGKSINGKVYYGRGLVQLTWLDNYETFAHLLKIDLVNNPDLALDPDTAFDIMTAGMFAGLFSKGNKLSKYINNSVCDYAGARKIINGRDKAALIAGYAENFEQILRSSAAASPIIPSDQSNPQSAEPAAPAALETEQLSANVPPPDNQQLSEPIEVHQIEPEKEEPKDLISKFKAWYLAVPAGVTTFLSAGEAWAKDAPLTLILWLLGIFGAIVVIYILGNFLTKNLRESREAKLTEQRESRAHELQLLTANAAASKDLNNIRIVPTPIKNSDS